MIFSTVEEIKDFVYTRIVRDRIIKRYADRAVSQLYLKFFDNLNNPQQKIKVIHIAGTSGKGSTCNFISHILISQGFKVGMTVSPYIEKFQERIQINNECLSDQKFVEYFNEIYEILIQTEKGTGQTLSTFEILTGLTFWSFWKEKVDYAVIEVGLGGRLDGTNVPNSTKICVLNTIGLDHERFLGNTLELIADQKAGIIQRGNLAVALSQTTNINSVFQSNADAQNVDLEFVFSELDFESPNIKINSVTNRPFLTFNYNDCELECHSFQLNQIGDYQASNCALALRTIEIIAERDEWDIDWTKVQDELKMTTFKGRFQFYDLPNKNLLILDGAHNPQKMQAFAGSVGRYYPNQKFNWVVGIKGDKGASEIIDQIVLNIANINKIIFTEFEVGATKIAEQVVVSKYANELAKYLESNTSIKVEIQTDITNIVSEIKESEEDFIITGSLYLVGRVLNILNDNF